MRLCIVVSLLLVGSLTGELTGQVVPDKVTFNYKTLRKLLPPDGTLIEIGQVSKDYVGIALGHVVTAKGKKVIVSDKLGSPGIVFGQGYIEVNLGVHFEKEVKKGPFRPTAAIDGVVQALVRVDDQFRVHIRINRLELNNDNLGGAVALALARQRIEQEVNKQVSIQAAKLTEYLKKQSIPKGMKIRITPTCIELTRNPMPVPKPQEKIVRAELHFHTTNDDREGGVVTVEIQANRTTFLRTSAPEYPKWRDKSRHTLKPGFGNGIPLPNGPLVAIVKLTEAREKNIGWNFNTTLTLITNRGRRITFQQNGVRLDTTGKPRGSTVQTSIPHVR